MAPLFASSRLRRGTNANAADADAAYRARAFRCDFCTSRFERRHDLTRHRKVHMNIRDYVCPFCPERFAQKNGLDVHKRTHAGLRILACPEAGCDVWPFRDESSYRRHWQNMHSPEPPCWKCNKCPHEASRKSLLTKHMRDKHRGALLPLEYRQRRARGSSTIAVPPATKVHVYDEQLPDRPTRRARGCNRSVSIISHGSAQSAATCYGLSEPTTSTVRNITPDMGFTSDSGSAFSTPSPSLSTPGDHHDPFSLRVPSLPPVSPSYYDSDSEKTEVYSPIASVEYPASPMHIPVLPSMMQLGGPPIMQHAAPFMPLEDSAIPPAGFDYSVYSLDNDFSALGLQAGQYVHPIPDSGLTFPDQDMLEFFLSQHTEQSGYTADNAWADSMIDPALLGDNGHRPLY